MNGLSVPFNAFHTSIRTLSGTISLEELHTLLIAEELTTMAALKYVIETILTVMAAFHPSKITIANERAREVAMTFGIRRAGERRLAFDI